MLGLDLNDKENAFQSVNTDNPGQIGRPPTLSPDTALISVCEYLKQQKEVGTTAYVGSDGVK